MTVSQKVIKETAEMLKAEYEFQYTRWEQTLHTDTFEHHKTIMGMDMAGYFARQMATIFSNDNPAFDEKKFFSMCGMAWLS